ncbi:dehydrogenase [Trypanosoma cruzi cruzi]|nr:dehydrogenase [Trypanosoma cruzi cruzi]
MGQRKKLFGGSVIKGGEREVGHEIAKGIALLKCDLVLFYLSLPATAMTIERIFFYSFFLGGGINFLALIAVTRNFMPNGVTTVCPSNVRLVRALVECRQPCVSNRDPMRETLLALGFPRQHRAINPGVTMRKPEL